MILPFELRPAEIVRKFGLFLDHLRGDYDLRFPEIRKRKLLELKLLNPRYEEKELERLLQDYQLSNQRISMLDFKVLWEWHLRYLKEELEILIRRSQHDFMDRMNVISAHPTLEAIEMRLRSLAAELPQLRLQNDPGLWDLIQTRWRLATIEEEFRYLELRSKILINSL